MTHAPRPSGAPRRHRPAHPSGSRSRHGRALNLGAATVEPPAPADEALSHANPEAATSAPAPAVADEDRAWQRIAELLLELALTYDPNIVELVEPPSEP